MGVVGALAPTVFVSMGASTHAFGNFSYISISFHKDYDKKVMILAIHWQKVMSSTHSLKLLTGPWVMLVVATQTSHFVSKNNFLV